MVLSNSSYFKNVMEVVTNEDGVYAGYRLPISIYKEICDNTIGRKEGYDITYQNDIDDDEITFGGVMFDVWYDVIDEYVYQYLDGTIEVNGSLKDYNNSECEYSFRAYGYASEKSSLGMVIERVEIDNHLEKWQIAYMNWILQWNLDTTFELFDLNGDEIPEIAAIGVCIADGKYGAENNDDIREDENGEPIYVYEWEGNGVEKEEYMKNVKELIDKDSAKSITYEGVSAEIIVQEIRNYLS